MDDLDELLRRLREVETEVAVLKEKQATDAEAIKGLKGGVSRGLWVVGGGFISAIVAWVVGGGLK